MDVPELVQLHIAYMRAIKGRVGYEFDGIGGLRAVIHRVHLKYEIIRRAEKGCSEAQAFVVLHKWGEIPLAVAA
jgi:hypothetical protein